MDKQSKKKKGIAKTNWTSLMLSFLFILILAEAGAHLVQYIFSKLFSLSELEESFIEPILSIACSFVPLWYYLIKPLKNEFQRVASELYSYESALQQHAIITKTDPEGRITYANNKFLEISEYSEEEILGKDHRIVNSGHHAPEFFANMWKTIKSNRGWRGQVCNKSKNGHFYWVDSAITPITNPENGKIQEYLSIRFDITAEKERGQKQMHTSKLISLGEMAASMAHEINNPLSIISGTVQRLERSNDESKIPTIHFQKIQKSVDKIAKIINGLQRFSRSNPASEKSIYSLSEMAKEALSLTEVKANYLKTSIDLDIEFEAFISCNEIEIEQVIINVINNAIDAIQGLDEKWVKIKVLEDNSQAVVRIIDSGLGVPDNVHDKIFDPFFTTKEIGKGTGLGLSTAKGIIEDHNGTISVLKNMGNTCFEIRFPVVQQFSNKIAA
ncbi:MAG: PAS domain-containing sensor histidine kinase [Bacteriovorax sp.]